MSDIGRVIFTILSADSTLNTALGASTSTTGQKKIYPNMAPQNETAPYIVYQRSTTQPDFCKEGMPIVLHYYTVAAFAANPDTLNTIANRIVTLLNNQAGTYGTTVVTGIKYNNDQDEIFELEPVLFAREIEFEIRETR